MHEIGRDLQLGRALHHLFWISSTMALNQQSNMRTIFNDTNFLVRLLNSTDISDVNYKQICQTHKNRKRKKAETICLACSEDIYSTSVETNACFPPYCTTLTMVTLFY